jgi:arylsulfatase A-like enzyme
MNRGMARTAYALVLAATLSGCGGCADAGGPAGGAPADPDGDAAREHEVLSFVDALPSCDIGHAGLLIDFGTPATAGRHADALEPSRGLVASEHDGATFARVFDRSIRLRFHLVEAMPVFVSVRGIGRSALKLGVAVDEVPLGVLQLTRDEIAIDATRPSAQSLDAGLHEIELRFRGQKGSEAQPFAELDWVRVGVSEELEGTYGAPTLGDVLVPNAQLGGVPHRGISLRAPAVVRCTARVPVGARFRVAVGMRGTGHAVAAVRARRDGEPAEELGRVEVRGGQDAAWEDLEIPLDAHAGAVVALELVAEETSGTGRVVFGDPAILAQPRSKVTTRPARAAVVVVLDAVERHDLPPWEGGETPHLPTLKRLSRNGTVFLEHRSASTLVQAAMASLLSGLPPPSHALADAGARLPEAVTTIGGIAHEASVRAGMFTAVPTTFKPFGFAARWDHFVQYPPNEGRPAAAPLEDAGAWLTDEKGGADPDRPVLAVVHARGGHPPWDVTPAEAGKLPPADYSGDIGPRRAGQALARTEGRHTRLSGADRERLRALYYAGLSRQDEALGKLVARLEESGRWDSTLFVVTADVASAQRTLFADGLDLDEELLAVPLYVHFPGGAHAGASFDQPTEAYDVTRTVLAALGLEPPHGMMGRDLAAVAAGEEDGTDALRVAWTDTAYAARWGDLVLLGRAHERPRLCQLSIDPTCLYDRAERLPFAFEALYQRMSAFERARPRPPDREPVTLDSDAAAMLKVWGSY